MVRMVGMSIGRVAANIIVEDDQQWPEFKDIVWKLFQQGELKAIESGFSLL
jgi:hypothetical protein